MGRMGAVVGIIGVVLVAVAMMGSWWTWSVEASAFGMTAKGTADFGMFSGTLTTETPAGSSSEPANYAESANIGNVFMIASLMVAAALVLGVLMVILGAASGSRPGLGRVAGIAGILAFVVALAGVMYVMAALPGAVNNDSGTGSTQFDVTGFWGSQSTDFLGATATVNWGAGWGWYLALIGAIVMLAGGVLAFRRARPTPAPQMMPGQPMYPGYPQAPQWPVQPPAGPPPPQQPPPPGPPMPP